MAGLSYIYYIPTVYMRHYRTLDEDDGCGQMHTSGTYIYTSAEASVVLSLTYKPGRNPVGFVAVGYILIIEGFWFLSFRVHPDGDNFAEGVVR